MCSSSAHHDSDVRYQQYFHSLYPIGACVVFLQRESPRRASADMRSTRRGLFLAFTACGAVHHARFISLDAWLLLKLPRLDDVAFLDVVEATQADTTFVALADLGGVVLEAT